MPLVTGSWATSYSEGWEPGARIKIPKYEYEVYNFLSKNLLHGQRILSLPLQSPLTGTTNYFATDILLFMGIPSFSGYGYMPELDNKIYIALADQINSEDTRNLSQELAVLGIKYITVHLDYNPKSFVSGYLTNLSKLISTLNNTKGLTYVGRIGQRAIYEVKDPYPLIYATSIPMELNRSIYSFPNDIPRILSNPVVNYSVISPVSYEVNIQNATKPFILVFGKTFDSNWQLECDELSTKHYLVYGFANGWLINKTGSFTLRIYYTPQKLYEITIIATFIGLIVPFSLLVFNILRR
ncbi:MAG: hypothetical protein ACP5HX_11615 [Thermoproteota archaeon]